MRRALRSVLEKRLPLILRAPQNLRMIKRIIAGLAALLLVLWGAFNFVLDMIGHATVVDDFNLLVERLPDMAQWLYGTPAWAPATLAVALLLVFGLDWDSASSAGGRSLWERLAKRRNKWQRLGDQMESTASLIDLLQSGYGHEGKVLAEIQLVQQAAFVHKIAYPQAGPEGKGSARELENYLREVGALLKAGEVKLAKARAAFIVGQIKDG